MSRKMLTSLALLLFLFLGSSSKNYAGQSKEKLPTRRAARFKK